MGYLLLFTSDSSFLRLYFVCSVCINIDGNKRGQTSRLVAGTQIQTSCNFEKNENNCDRFLDFVHRWCIYYYLESIYNHNWYQHIVAGLCLVTIVFAYTKIFCTLRHNQIHFRNHVVQGQPSQAIPLNIARYRKAVYSALWVQGTFVVCYLPFTIAVALMPERGIPISAYRAWHFTATLVYLNSSLNPLLYCWKISEVREAVKETLRQLFCRSS